jgi:hypothetical protein
VAGKALAQSYVSPAIFAVCLAAGSGGTVEALLLCNRPPFDVVSTNEIIRIATASDTGFSSTINGTPGATLVYNAPTGNEDSIVPAATTELAKLMLWNTTKSPDEYALIQAVNTGTNTITPTATITGWSDSESIQVSSTTATGTINGVNLYDIQILDTSTIPALAVAIVFEIAAVDSGTIAAATQAFVHPYEATSGSKLQTVTLQVSAQTNRKYAKISLIQRRFCIGFNASGAGTMTFVLRLLGYVVAAP